MSGQIHVGVSVSQQGLQDIDKLVSKLQKTGEITEKTAASFKTSTKGISEFLGQVKAAQTSLTQMAEAYNKGGLALREFNAGLKASTAQTITDRKAVQDLVTTYQLWGGTFDTLYSKQYRKIVTSKAEQAVTSSLLGIHQKIIATKAQEIALTDSATIAMGKALAVTQADLAIKKAHLLVDEAYSKQMMVNAVLRSGETLAIKQQALAYAGIPPIKMAVAAATEAEAMAANASAGANMKSAAATTAAGRAASGASGAFTTYGSAVRGAAGAMGMLWFAYGQLLPMMAAFAGVRVAKEAMSLGVAFEYTTKSIQSLSKDVEGAAMPLEKIQQQLMAMEGLRHTPTELAAGMREFAKAGIGPADALRDLATMSKFATIAEMDLGEAIKDIIGLTLAFQPTMEAATGEMFTFADAANMVAAAAMLSITDVKEMSSAFSHAAELGIVSKMRFEEVAASLAIMANAGIRGTKAATSLRTGMLKLQTAGDPVHKMFAELGRKFNAFNEDGSVKNVIETFEELNRALIGVTDEKRIAVFTKLFTARSMKAGAVLSQQVKELDAFIKKLEEAAEGMGFIEEKYQDLASTVGAELDYLRVEVEKQLLGMVNTDWLAEMVSGLREFVHSAAPEVRDALGGIKDTLEILYTSAKTFQDLGGPSMGEWGLIGYALLRGGPQAAAVVAALSVINEALAEFGLNIGALGPKAVSLNETLTHLWEGLSGQRDMDTGQWSFLVDVPSHEELSWGVAAYADSIYELANQTKIGVNSAVSSHQTFLQSLDELSRGLAAFYGSGLTAGGIGDALSSDEQAMLDRLLPLQKAQKDFAQGLIELDVLAKKTGMSTTDYNIALENLKKSTTESTKFTKESTKAFKDHSNEIQNTIDKYLPLKKEVEETDKAERILIQAQKDGKITADELVVALDNLTKSTTAYKDKSKEAAEQVKQIKKNLEEWEKQQKAAADLASKRSKAYQDIYKELADSSAKMSWESYQAQRQAIDEGLADYESMQVNEDLLRELRKKREEELYIKWARSAGGFFDGFAAGALEAANTLNGLGEVGYKVFNELTETFQGTFVAAIKGDFESIGDLWDSLLDRMLDLFINWIASLLARWAMGALGSAILGGLGGGWSGALSGLAGAFGGGGGGGGAGSYLGAAASIGSTGYQMYTGESALAAAAKWAAAKAGITQAAPAAQGAAEGLGIYQGSSIGAGAGGGLGTYGASQGTYGVLSSQAGASPGTYGVLASDAAPAAPSGAGAGFSGLSSAAGMAAIAVTAAVMFVGHLIEKQKPHEADAYNAMGLRPADFASLIGEGFKRVVLPVLGESNAKWDVATSTMLLAQGPESFKAQRDRGRSDLEEFPNPAATGISGMTWNASATTWERTGNFEAEKILRGEGLFQMLGHESAPKTIEEYAAALERAGVALDASTVQDLWEWGQATRINSEIIKDAQASLAAHGGDLKKALDLVEWSMLDLGGSAAEAEKYLSNLGYTQKETTELIQGLDRTLTKGRAGLGSMSDMIIRALFEQGQISEVTALAMLRQNRATQLLEESSLMAGTNITMASVGLGQLGSEASQLLGTSSVVSSSLGAAGDQFQDFADTVVSGIGHIRYSAESLFDLAAPTEAPPEAGMKNGGIIGYASGGLLRGGSMVRDDLYLGTVNGVAQVAQGGEYIMPQDQTKKHLRLLENIRADRYADGGPTRLPAPGTTPRPGAGDLLSDVRHSRTPDDLKSLQDMMRDISRSMSLMAGTDLDKALLELYYQFEDQIKEAKALGASEVDLNQIRQLQVAEAAELIKANKEAQSDFMTGIQDQIDDFGLSDLESALRETRRERDEQIKQAKELGLGEEALIKIRELQKLKAMELRDAQAKALGDFMLDVTDQMAMLGMSETDKALFQLNREMEDMIESAKELGASESDLAKIRELYGMKAAEAMNQGLKEAVTAMGSFRDSMLSLGDASVRSAGAQQELFNILGQARKGDFSGVEAIGDVLKDISIDKSKYATAADYARDYWKTIGAVNELERLTTGRMEANEQSVPVISVRDIAESDRKSTAAMVAELQELRGSIVEGNVQNIKTNLKTARLIERWEAIGMPITRTA